MRSIRFLIDGLLLVVIAIGLTGAGLGRLFPALGHPVYVVAGPSMTPTISVGSAVIVDVVPTGDLRVGDVVTLRTGPQRAIFTHRIVRVAMRDGAVWIQTKGDANDEPDPAAIPATDVIGRSGYSLPGAGYIIALLSAPSGVLLVLSCGALLLVLGWWLDALERDRRRARNVAAVTSGAGALPAPSPAPSGARPTR